MKALTISKVFVVQDKILEKLKKKIEKFGYDKSQPVVVWTQSGHCVPLPSICGLLNAQSNGPSVAR